VALAVLRQLADSLAAKAVTAVVVQGKLVQTA
jgi:hypothetical protein